METVSILGIPISRAGFDEALQLCEERVNTKQGGYVCLANVHTVTESTRYPALADALKNAYLSLADGMPLVWVSRWKHNPVKTRVCGPDLTREFLLRHPETSMGFVGGRPGQGDDLARRFSLKNTTSYATPIRPFSPENAQEDWRNFISRCPNQQAPSVVWIGLGAPKQELWARTISPLAPQTLFFAVGAAFDFLTDTKKRAPLWMQKSGLEWFYRLAQEPRRLAKRYLTTNFEFVGKVTLELLKNN